MVGWRALKQCGAPAFGVTGGSRTSSTAVSREWSAEGAEYVKNERHQKRGKRRGGGARNEDEHGLVAVRGMDTTHDWRGGRLKAHARPKRGRDASELSARWGTSRRSGTTGCARWEARALSGLRGSLRLSEGGPRTPRRKRTTPHVPRQSASPRFGISKFTCLHARPCNSARLLVNRPSRGCFFAVIRSVHDGALRAPPAAGRRRL